ncbi:MAG TPA: response regulator transcription factor [Bacteroidales bacterium]|nr:response regulator transcription factor [Bacteroidales bacterium]
MNKKIGLLLVDDNQGFIDAVGMYLSIRKKYSIIGSASNGLELLNHPLLYKADVILMDCEMPVMNGIQAARQVNIQWPYKKLIAVTMFDDHKDLVELLGAGFNGYIYKPDIASKLETVIERVVNDEYVFDTKTLLNN